MTERFWVYAEYAGEAPHGPKDAYIAIKSDSDIIREYGPWWVQKMYELGRHDKVTRETLIMDWVAINWASELK